MNQKYVWLNLVNGEFSNSWNEKEHELYGGSAFTEENLNKARANHWVLLKYECVNDPYFEIYRQMKLK
jgi:hypothetical protein